MSSPHTVLSVFHFCGGCARLTARRTLQGMRSRTGGYAQARGCAHEIIGMFERVGCRSQKISQLPYYKFSNYLFLARERFESSRRELLSPQHSTSAQRFSAFAAPNERRRLRSTHFKGGTATSHLRRCLATIAHVRIAARAPSRARQACVSGRKMPGKQTKK